MRRAGLPEELEHRRYLAVERILEGYTTQEVAEFLGVEPSSVRRWRDLFEREGGEGLRAHCVPGRPRKLTRTEEKVVLRWLRDSPTEHGFSTELWTGKRLAQLIEEEFRVRLSRGYLPRWLQARGYSCQKPQRVPRQRDMKKITAWLEHDWPRIKRKAHRENAGIALIDESGVLMAPLARRTWAPRGQPPQLAQESRRQKVSIAAALWMPPSRKRLGLFSETLVNAYFNNIHVAVFVDDFLTAHRGRWIVLWDGGPMHKGDPIWELLDRYQARLVIEPLPPYAPRLNPVEPLWSWLKYTWLANFTPHDVVELHHAVTGELQRVAGSQDRLKNLFLASELPSPRALLM